MLGSWAKIAEEKKEQRLELCLRQAGYGYDGKKDPHAKAAYGTPYEVQKGHDVSCPSDEKTRWQERPHTQRRRMGHPKAKTVE